MNRTLQASLASPFARPLHTKHNEAGRGGEFGELVRFQDRLWTFDDRSGIGFEILNTAVASSYVAPRLILAEGDGRTDKGFKVEWASVKDNELYVGSIGKAYVDNKTGQVRNTNLQWVNVLNRHGHLVRREKWIEKYQVVRKAVGAAAPGYIIVEAVEWSDHFQKWIFLPRRISREPYNDIQDEQRGAHVLVWVDESFTQTHVQSIAFDSLDPLKGISSIAFVPGTSDRHAMIIRTVEEHCAEDEDDNPCYYESYFVVIDVTTGEQLSDEVKFPQENMKFEGVEFVDMSVKSPV